MVKNQILYEAGHGIDYDYEQSSQGELSCRLEVVDAELSDVRKRLEKLYEAIETSKLTLDGSVAPHHVSEAP